MVIDCTFRKLLDEIGQIRDDYSRLLEHYSTRACMFEQCVSYDELLDIKCRLDMVLEKAHALESSERTEVENGVVPIADAIDMALYRKDHISEK